MFHVKNISIRVSMYIRTYISTAEHIRVDFLRLADSTRREAQRRLDSLLKSRASGLEKFLHIYRLRWENGQARDGLPTYTGLFV